MRNLGRSSRSRLWGINVSLHMIIQTDVLAGTLHVLGATARWATCTFFGTQDQAVTVIALVGAATVFDTDGGTLAEYWWCDEQRHTLAGADGGQWFKGLNTPGSPYVRVHKDTSGAHGAVVVL